MGRIIQDVHDIIVWPLTETSGPYKNLGNYLQNDSSTDLVITNTISPRDSNGFFGNCPLIPGTSNFPSGSSSTRNYAAGAKTITPSAPFTVSCWVNLKSYNSSNNQQIIAKEYRDSAITSSWTTPFMAIGIYTTTSSGGLVWEASIATSSSTRAVLTVSDFPIPISQWSHIGMTYDGSNIRAYLNGCQCIYYSGGQQNTVAASAISYTDGVNGFGNWRIGAITHTGSSNKEEPNMQIQDVRIANIARPLSYFKYIFSNGITPTFEVNGTQYYKLRAYDTSCITPTAVVWVDTQISLTNAPAFPCSGPYTTPEVLDTWII